MRPPLEFRPPPCKSAFQRALFLALLRGGETVLESDEAASADVDATARVVRALGATVERTATGLRIESPGWNARAAATLDVGESATAARTLLGLIACLGGEHCVAAAATLLRRPIGDALLETIASAGGQVQFAADSGYFPIEISASGALDGPLLDLSVDTKHSSQGATGLLLGLAVRGGRLRVHGPLGYLGITEGWLGAFEAACHRQAGGEAVTFACAGGELSGPRSFRIPSDMSAACFFLAWAVGHQQSAVVRGLELAGVGARHPDTEFLRVLQDLGQCLTVDGDALSIDAQSLGGFDFYRELEEAPDSIAPWTALLSSVEGCHSLRGTKLRHKESDRLAVLAAGLVACGFEARVEGDALCFKGRPPGTVRPSNTVKLAVDGDHRMAMAFAILASIHDFEIEVDDPECVRKSFPAFWDELARWEAWRRGS